MPTSTSLPNVVEKLMLARGITGAADEPPPPPPPHEIIRRAGIKKENLFKIMCLKITHLSRNCFIFFRGYSILILPSYFGI